MKDEKLNEKKLWESAYTVMNHPRMGPYLHGAGMVERTTGITQYWLVRGPCTQSVVQELQRQLGNAYSYARPEQPIAPQPKPAPASPPAAPKTRGTDRLLACLLLVGMLGVVFRSFVRA